MLLLLFCSAWLATTTVSAQKQTESSVQVNVPFGEAAIWATSGREVAACAAGRFEEETTQGVVQALKYAVNNARIAVKHVTLTEKTINYFSRINKLAVEVAKIEKIQQETKKWKKQFKKTIKGILKLFAEKTFVTLLKEANTTLEIPDNHIGLTWQSSSLQLPIYSRENVKQGLSELKFKMKDGTEIPRVGFGTWQMEGQECTDAVLAALKTGYRHIDTAQSYGNEADVGKGIQEAIKQGIIKSREDIFLSSKLSNPNDYGTKKTAESVKNQLKSLQTSYLDLYMLHGPETPKKNRAAWKAMSKLVKEGKIKSLGISNFETYYEVKQLSAKMEVKPSYIQNKFSIYSPGGQSVEQGSMLRAAEKRKMAFVGYSVVNAWPFVLSPIEDPHVVAIAKQYNKTPAQVLYRWALQLNVIVIPKSRSPARIEENAGILEFAIKDADMWLLNGLSSLYQSTEELKPSFAADVYGLFEEEEDGDDRQGKEEGDGRQEWEGYGRQEQEGDRRQRQEDDEGQEREPEGGPRDSEDERGTRRDEL